MSEPLGAIKFSGKDPIQRAQDRMATVQQNLRVGNLQNNNVQNATNNTPKQQAPGGM